MLNVGISDFWCTKINNHLFCFEKICKYIFKTDAKIYIRAQSTIELENINGIEVGEIMNFLESVALPSILV